MSMKDKFNDKRGEQGMENMKFTEIEVQIETDVEETEHWHGEIEFLYVIHGTGKVTVEESEYDVIQNEMILINSGKKHSVSTQKDSMLCRIYLPYHDICNYLQEDYVLLECNSLIEKGYKYEQLKQYVKELLMTYIEKDTQLIARMSLKYKILDYLIKYFYVDFGKKTGESRYVENQRISVILNYIYANYTETISLTEIAEKVYMSPSSLSRFFKKKMGESFVQFVRRTRLQKAAEQLIYTSLSISKIAVNNGFSNPSAMNKDFKDMYGVTPKEYRKQHQIEALEKNKELETKRLQKFLDVKETTGEQVLENKKYCIDTKKYLSYKPWKNKVLNVGPADILGSANIRKQLLEMRDKLDIEYIRIWNVFSTNMMFVRRENRLNINYSKLDEILDFCVENQFRLYFDFGQRVNRAMASNVKEIFSVEENLIFESKDEWETFLELFIVHITKRYGIRVVSEWIYEFSFFLNERPYYQTDYYSAKAVWNRGYEIVKDHIPTARIAGPGLLLVPDEETIEIIIEDFLNSEYKPDIFSTLNFPYAGKKGIVEFRRITDEDFLEKQIQMVKRILDKHHFENEYYVVDWCSSMANRNYIQDSCHRATSILRNVTRNYPKVDALGLWYASDLLNVYFDSEGIVSGSAGLVTRDGILKPAFYAFEFLNAMGCYYLGMSDCYLATKDEQGDIRLIVFNYKKIGPRYYMVEEDSYQPGEVEELFTNHDCLRVDIILDHLEEDSLYQIRQKIVNPETGSVLEKWIELGCEENLLGEDITYLKQICTPKVSINLERTKHEKLHLNLQLMPHEFRWISIKKI